MQVYHYFQGFEEKKLESNQLSSKIKYESVDKTNKFPERRPYMELIVAGILVIAGTAAVIKATPTLTPVPVKKK